MASATLSSRDGGAWRPEKRQRAQGIVARPPAGARRLAFEEHKRLLLAREQEGERRRVEEALRRLDAIEEQRRRARERKLDRERRRAAFAATLEKSTIMLQRCERGRQARRVARRRARAVAQIVKWMLAKIRRMAMIKAIRNRTILRIMVSVERMVDEQIEEACFVVKNMCVIRPFRQHRAARIIQRAIRDRATLVRRSSSIIVRAVRCWLARGRLRRARIRRSILRHRGSLSRRALGLSERDLLALTTYPSVRGGRGGLLRDGRWWNAGMPVGPRSRWRHNHGVVEREEERSRQRAASLADLIRSGDATGGVAGDAIERAKRAASRRRPTIAIGFRAGASTQRSVSMVDPREAEVAAWMGELARGQARREAGATAMIDYSKMTLREKHLCKEREFQAAKDKRRLAAEKEVQRKENLKAREAVELVRRKARHSEMLRQKEEEKAQLRLEKIRDYKERKAAKDLADRKALAAKKEEERRVQELAEAKRRAAEAAFEREKAERLERVRKKRRAEEAAKLREIEEARRQKGARAEGGKGAPSKPPPSAATPCLRPSRSPKQKSGIAVQTAAGRTALAPISSSNGSTYNRGVEERKRRRVRLRGDGVPLSPVRRSRITVGVRDGRLKLPHGAMVPALPVVPGWKAMSGGGGRRGGDRKRVRRRPQRGGRGSGGKEGWRRASGEFDDALMDKGRNSSADLGGLIPTPGGENSQGTRANDAEEGIIETTVVVDKCEALVEGTSRRLTAQKTATSYFDAVVVATGEEQGATEAENAEGESQGDTISDVSEPAIMDTLDFAFPAPGPGAETGGGGGLGATSAPESLSPGWSSCSSRNSNDDQYCSDNNSFESDDSAVSGRGGKAWSSDGGVDAGRRGADPDTDNKATDQVIMSGGGGERDDEVSLWRGFSDKVSYSRSDVEDQYVDIDDDDDDDGDGDRNASEVFLPPSIGQESLGLMISQNQNDNHGQPSTKPPMREETDRIDQQRYTCRDGAESNNGEGDSGGDIRGSYRQHTRDGEALEGSTSGRASLLSAEFANHQMVESAPRSLSRPAPAQEEEEDLFALLRAESAAG